MAGENSSGFPSGSAGGVCKSYEVSVIDFHSSSFLRDKTEIYQNLFFVGLHNRSRKGNGRRKFQLIPIRLSYAIHMSLVFLPSSIIARY
jgi:hypothetical protein